MRFGLLEVVWFNGRAWMMYAERDREGEKEERGARD
jgi:hypothetical protein